MHKIEINVKLRRTKTCFKKCMEAAPIDKKKEKTLPSTQIEKTPIENIKFCNT